MTDLFDKTDKCFEAMVGVGGVGGGSFFMLQGNHTLGREESRQGIFLDQRDYCKLHIISHYVQVLSNETFRVLPISKIGNDEPGKRILTEMSEIGINTDYISTVDGLHTLFSFCFIYPDGSGGNLTTNNSACSEVTPDSVETIKPICEKLNAKGIALALPEVPLPARERLLSIGTEYGMLRIASFTSEELKTQSCRKILQQIDLLAINVDEAACLADIDTETIEDEDVVLHSIEIIKNINPHLHLSVTAGPRGSWVWDCNKLTYLPVFQTDVVNTAGAGDAYLAGLIIGLTANLPLSDAAEIAGLNAALSVQSQNTINTNINTDLFRNFSSNVKSLLSENVINALGI